jgi:hypothetical protein
MNADAHTERCAIRTSRDGWDADCTCGSLPVCAGQSHQWPADYSDGDTCMCGVFYLDTRKDGVVVVTETPQEQPDQETRG